MNKRLIAGLAGLVAIASLGLGVAPANATTGGTPDGDLHPNVGLILYYAEDGRYRCSATLVSPTVVVTAAHCTDGVLGSTLVTFESEIAEQAPSGFPVAADPTVGYTPAELAAAGYISGTAHTHPDYSGFTDLANWNDVGVIVLDSPVASFSADGYDPIAPVGTLSAIKKADISKTIFTAVGYGTEVRKPDNGPQKPQPMTYPLLRRYVDMPGQKLTEQILQTNGNPNDSHGTGGTCFGDSGGPVYLNGEIVAVTSYGYTDNCRYLGGYQRLDIPVVADWLATFGV
jgi:hypothetical protein